MLRPTHLLKRINSELRTVRVLRKEELTLQGIKELNNYQKILNYQQKQSTED